MQYPEATFREVVNFSNVPMTQHLGLVFHVQEGDNSLFGWFNDPASSVSSHFWIGKDGAVEQ